MKIDADDLHCLPDKQHKDCDWYHHEEMECTNWGEFMEDCLPAFVECYAPIGSIFKEYYSCTIWNGISGRGYESQNLE